jgi:hypothetical protein
MLCGVTPAAIARADAAIIFDNSLDQGLREMLWFDNSLDQGLREMLWIRDGRTLACAPQLPRWIEQHLSAYIMEERDRSLGGPLAGDSLGSEHNQP